MSHTKMELQTYETAARGWSSVSDVDWSLVTSQLADVLCHTVAHFASAKPGQEVYGIVIENAQGWCPCVYLNTEEGLLKGPALFRPGTRGYEHKTDAELLADLGRWYYQAWEFQLYQYEACPDIRGLNNLHYELFGHLFSRECDEGAEVQGPGLSELFLQAVARATAILETSPELHSLLKTSDFSVRLYDCNCLEWETDEVMADARCGIETGRSQS